jgi:hypothetical protein
LSVRNILVLSRARASFLNSMSFSPRWRRPLFGRDSVGDG